VTAWRSSSSTISWSACLALDFILTALWVYARIQSPLLISCSYGLIRRFDRLASPWLVVPSVSIVSSIYFLVPVQNADFPLLWSHIPIAGAMLISIYLWLGWIGYSRPESLVLSVLTVIALDVLWQIPWDVPLWVQSWHNFAVGMTTMGWDAMSIPFLGYFVLKFNGRWVMDSNSAAQLGIATIWTLSYCIWLPLSFDDYILILPWSAFFLGVFYNSRKASVLEHGP
jgi:hypothetical protein